MEIGFKGVKDTSFASIKVSGQLPVELDLLDSTKGGNSLKIYVKSLDYLFRGVTNFANGKILGTSVNIEHLGSIVKNGSKLEWGLNIPQSNVVTYDVNIVNIKENMYYADAIVSNGVNIKPIENKGLLKLSNNRLRSNLIKGVISLGESDLPYYYSYENNKLLLKVKGKDTVIDVDDVVEDDIFIALKLMELFMCKNEHLGVVMLDCEGFSDSTLAFIVSMYNNFQKEYGVNLLFLYNKRKNSNIKTEKVYLPSIDK